MTRIIEVTERLATPMEERKLRGRGWHLTPTIYVSTSPPLFLTAEGDVWLQVEE